MTCFMPYLGIIMFRYFVVLLICLHVCNSTNRKPVRFEVILEHIQPCKNPNPPDADRVTMTSKYDIHLINGKRVFSGNTTVIAPTPFLNFSARSYSVDNTGRRLIRFEISEVSCKNVIARSILMLSNVTFSTKNCLLRKGFYRYQNMDLNKISHALPGWHVPGQVIHEMQLVRQGAKVTEFCHEVKVLIRDPRKINN